MQKTKYLTAIIYTENPQPVTGNKYLKYRNIQDNQAKIAGFCKFAAKFNGSVYVNFYNSETKKFKERIYL